MRKPYTGMRMSSIHWHAAIAMRISLTCTHCRFPLKRQKQQSRAMPSSLHAQRGPPDNCQVATVLSISRPLLSTTDTFFLISKAMPSCPPPLHGRREVFFFARRRLPAEACSLRIPAQLMKEMTSTLFLISKHYRHCRHFHAPQRVRRSVHTSMPAPTILSRERSGVPGTLAPEAVALASRVPSSPSMTPACVAPSKRSYGAITAVSPILSC